MTAHPGTASRPCGGRVQTGIERLVREEHRKIAGLRIGLLTHPAAVGPDLRHCVEWLREAGADLRALFGPEHGLWGEAQDQAEVAGGRDRRTGLQVHSLYGDHRVPTREMLEGLDLLVVDLQDIGVRYYTFLSTLALALEACAAQGVGVLVCDRPNPLGGDLLEGNVLDPAFRSFVGAHPLPVRHGLTPGEFARLYARERGLGVELDVVPLGGWERSLWFDATGLPWVLPSPNMPTLETATVYSGACLLEATNLSEGRGTTRPFEIVGAPFVDPWWLAEALAAEGLPGVAFRPLFFRPTFNKWAGTTCGGIQIHVTGRGAFRPYVTGIALLAAVRRRYPAEFRWREPPYEYETGRLPIDILCGTDRIRRGIEAGESWRVLEAEWTEGIENYRARRGPALLY